MKPVSPALFGMCVLVFVGAAIGGQGLKQIHISGHEFFVRRALPTFSAPRSAKAASPGRSSPLEQIEGTSRSS